MLKSILLLSSITMITNFKILVQTKGSSCLLRAHGLGGASATISFISAPPPEKIAGGFQQAGGASAYLLPKTLNVLTGRGTGNCQPEADPPRAET